MDARTGSRRASVVTELWLGLTAWSHPCDHPSSTYLRMLGRSERSRGQCSHAAETQLSMSSKLHVHFKERNPVPEPNGPSAISTEAKPAPCAEVDRATSLPHLHVGTTVWDAVRPLTPLVLSETERRFRFRGMPQAVGAARRALREWEGHFEPDLFYDLSLCVSELVTKSVQHAEPQRADEVELTVSRDDKLVRAEVMERCRDVAVTHPPTMDCDDWGMFIVDRVADRWGVDRSVGTRLWCEIDLAGSRRGVAGQTQRRAAVGHP